MPLTTLIEFTQLLRLSNAITLARTQLAEAHEELRRLRDDEMIGNVRGEIIDGRVISLLGEEIEHLNALMQKVTGQA